VILMVAFADDILRWTAGADFVAGAVVLQLLAAFLPFAFVNHVLWRLLIAFHEDRTLLGLAGSLITLTIVLDSILIPPYGMKAAALVTVGVEAFFVSTSAAVLWRRHQMTPSPRYAVAIVAASAPAAAVAAWLPGPAGVVAPTTLAVYLIVIAVLPGTVRVILGGAVTRLRAASWGRS
jgi:O-antigen/teichoic acid export membrane protein